MAISPGVATRRKLLQHRAPALAYEEGPLSAEVQRCPGDRERLTIKGDRPPSTLQLSVVR
jgi:hypothetical protein